MVKSEREQNESLNTVAVKTALEESHYSCHVTHQCEPEPAWGIPPVAKVMRKEPDKIQRRDQSSGHTPSPWIFLRIYCP